MDTTLHPDEKNYNTRATHRIRGLLYHLLRGRMDDPAWVRPAVLALLSVTTFLYIWNLSASGWANAYYSAAAQAASQNWKAFFFGSFDAANAITVDKTPAALWVMALSVRLFGLTSWSILIPQALAGVATVYLVYLSVRRVSSPAAGLVAAVVTALTPVAVLMFRYNNPDALLVLLMTAAACAMIRAQEKAQTHWLVLAGMLLGFGYLAKMLQVLLVVPVFAIVYLLTAPTTFWRRLWQGALAVAAMLVSAGWWVIIVEIWPADLRPYIGGSDTNSILDLMFGYNGLQRISGNQPGSVIGGGQAGTPGSWGETGLFRLFGAEVGTQVSWLIPAALVLLIAGLWWTLLKPRADSLRASYLLWGGWLILTGLVFSLMQGIFHAYYTVALAPAIGAVVGLGAVQAWQKREQILGRAILFCVVAITAWWAWVLLSMTPNWLPWMRVAVIVIGLAAAFAFLEIHRIPKTLTAALVALGATVCLAAPAAYAVETAITPASGSLPTAGPSGAVSGARGVANPGVRNALNAQNLQNARNPFNDGNRNNRQFNPNANQGWPFQQQNNHQSNNNGFSRNASGGNGGRATGGMNSIPFNNLPGDGGVGGLLNASNPGKELVDLLLTDADEYTWVAAMVGANSAAGIQLTVEEPVMAIGGFNGTDPWPALEVFQGYVNSGQIHYFLAGGRGMNGRGAASEITGWVEANFPAIPVNGTTVYDLSGGGY